MNGYVDCSALTDVQRKKPTLDVAFCWTHWRRDFFDLANGGAAPIASKGIARTPAVKAAEEMTTLKQR